MRDRTHMLIAQERSEADGAELAQLVEFEWRFLATLVSGSALSQHMVRARSVRMQA